jgi:bacteriocin biosynthesis cyclodehydratase domain-containing protein
MPRIRLSPSASVTPTERGVVLRSDLGSFEISGADVRAFLEAMVPLLDGSRDRGAVAEALDQFSRRSVLAFLDLLEEKGLVETAPDAGELRERWRGQDEFFRRWSRSPEEMARRLAESRVLIAGLSPWGRAAAAELAASGVGTIDVIDGDDLGDQSGGDPREALVRSLAEAAPWCRVTASPLAWTHDGELALDAGAPLHLVIGATPGGEARVLRALARFAHALGAVSLYGDLDGASGIIGPVVVPGKTACWSCVREPALLRYGPPAPAADQDRRRDAAPCSTMASLLGHLIALEALKQLTHYATSGLTGRVLVQDFVTLETTFFTVLRIPECPICGSSKGSAPPAR